MGSNIRLIEDSFLDNALPKSTGIESIRVWNIFAKITILARLQINLPEKFIFVTEIPVRVSDLNYGGHMGNDSILTLLQEARTLFYRHLGFESEIKLEGTVGQIIADAAIVYRSESFLGDVLVVQIAVADVTKYGFDLFYKITNKVTGQDVALGKTGIVCFDYEKRKVASVPFPLKQKLLTEKEF